MRADIFLRVQQNGKVVLWVLNPEHTPSAPESWHDIHNAIKDNVMEYLRDNKGDQVAFVWKTLWGQIVDYDAVHIIK